MNAPSGGSLTRSAGPAPRKAGRTGRRLQAGLLALASLGILAMGSAATASAATASTHSRTAAAAAPSSPAKMVGLVDGRLLGATTAQLNADLTQDASSGATALRDQLSWNAVEPTMGVYNWAPFDALVNAVAAHNMSLLVLIDFTPPWARATGCATWTCPPANPSQFASFAAMAAARYGNKVAAWEIWNEPNSAAFWTPAASPSAYSQLLNLTSAAIQAADPGAYIVSGGLAPEPDDGVDIDQVTFLSKVCSAGGLASASAIGDHPYSFPVLPDYPAVWNAWQQMNNTSPSLRSVMTSCGAASKPIWITEYGAPTNGPGVAATLSNYDLPAHPTHVDLNLQATMVTNAVSDVQADSWVGSLFFYSASDAGTAVTTNQNFFGLLNYDNTPKPAWSALQTALGAS